MRLSERAVCGNSARTDLWRGLQVTVIPTPPRLNNYLLIIFTKFFIERLINMETNSDNTPFDIAVALMKEYIGEPECGKEEDFWEKKFKKELTSPSMWLSYGVNLMGAGKTLYDIRVNEMRTHPERQHPHFIDISLMLTGYALECLCKGIYVIVNKEDVIKENKVNSKSKLFSHKILEIINKINEKKTNTIKLEDYEKKLLGELEQYVLWLGRYPVPKKDGEFRLYHFDTEKNKNLYGIYMKLYNILQDESNSVKLSCMTSISFYSEL